MAVYCKKPVLVHAWSVKDLFSLHEEDLPLQIKLAINAGEIVIDYDHIRVKTTEGEMIAREEDMLIYGTRGEYYPCKPGPFEDTFQLVQK